MRQVKKIGEWLLLGLATLVVLALLFVNVGPRFLPYQALVVRSGSMTPTIPTGSLVLYRKIDASSLKVGDVIVFNEPHTDVKVTHRIYAIDASAKGRYLITKGDANAVPDDWTIPAVGEGWIEFFHVPDVGYVLADLQGGNVRLLLIVVPAVLLAALAIYDFRRSSTKGSTKSPRRVGGPSLDRSPNPFEPF